MRQALSLTLAADEIKAIPSHREVLGAEVRLRAYWLGQAGFILDTPTARVVVDPYLSDSLAEKYRGKRFPHRRMMAPPIEAESLKDVDWVLSTHSHTDHLDPGTLPVLAQANPHCQFLLPKSAADKALERGVPAGRMTVCNSGDEITLLLREGDKDLDVFAIPAAHEERGYDEVGNDLFLGYILDTGGCKVYHSGDTVPFPELHQELSRFDIDLALLPVNGRDEDRRGNGIPGNLTLDETIDLARGQKIPFVIGHHYDMFDFNTIEPEWAERRIAELLPTGSGPGYRLAKTGVRYELRTRQFS